MTGYLEGEPPRVFAHRGLALEAPENTLLAFLHALKVGAEYLEIDVRATSDGVAVVCHDASLERTAGLGIEVAQVPWSTLKAVDLGGGERIATLAEALDAFPDARWNIDMKTDDAVQPAAREIRKARAESRVLVTSFHERRRRRIAALVPGAVSSASRAMLLGALLAQFARQQWLVRRILQPVVAVQVPSRVRWLRIVTGESVRSFHEAGVEVHVWTVNSAAEMRSLLAIGVDGIVTDRADIAVDVVDEHLGRRG